MSRLPLFVLVVLLTASLGCANEAMKGADSGSSVEMMATSETQVAQAPTGGGMGAMVRGPVPTAGSVPPGASRAPLTIPRKIVYTAEVDLYTDRFADVSGKVAALTSQHGGFIAAQSLTGQAGTRREGSWTVRVPVTRFEGFLNAVCALAELHSRQIHSQDVTDEYYDLDARVRNKRVEETRLLRHLQQSTAKLADILAVEQEISRVREEIERIEGRLRLLSNQTELTTITIQLHESKEYRPPGPPSFGAEALRTLGNSWIALVGALRALALFVLALLPWCAMVSLVGIPVFLYWRRSTPK